MCKVAPLRREKEEEKERDREKKLSTKVCFTWIFNLPSTSSVSIDFSSDTCVTTATFLCSLYIGTLTAVPLNYQSLLTAHYVLLYYIQRPVCLFPCFALNLTWHSSHSPSLALPCWLACSLPAAWLASLSSKKKGKNSTVTKLTVNSKKPVSRSYHPRLRHANFPPFPNPLSLSLYLASLNVASLWILHLVMSSSSSSSSYVYPYQVQLTAYSVHIPLVVPTVCTSLPVARKHSSR